MADVSERPILFSGPLIREILAGRKTQTRRLVKFPRAPNHLGQWEPTTTGGPDGGKLLIDGCLVPDPNPARVAMWHTRTGAHVWCPYGVPGDLLWVRETWGVGARPDPFEGCVNGLEYRADDYGLDDTESLPLHRPKLPDGVDLSNYESGRWRPSIHMPRWASRIMLEVTEIRIERLQEIGNKDAVAEGFVEERGSVGQQVRPGPRDRFAELWDQINGDRWPDRAASWEANPWVWVVSFRVVTP